MGGQNHKREGSTLKTEAVPYFESPVTLYQVTKVTPQKTAVFIVVTSAQISLLSSIMLLITVLLLSVGESFLLIAICAMNCAM